MAAEGRPRAVPTRLRPAAGDRDLARGGTADGGAGIPGFDEGGDDAEQDALYDEAVAYVLQSRRASISSVQRKLKIGYNRAARLVEAMEMAGVVSAPGHNGQREVVAPGPQE